MVAFRVLGYDGCGKNLQRNFFTSMACSNIFYNFQQALQRIFSGTSCLHFERIRKHTLRMEGLMDLRLLRCAKILG